MNTSIAEKRYIDNNGETLVLEVFSPRQVEVPSKDILWSCRFRISRDDVPVVEKQALTSNDALDAFLRVIADVKTTLGELERPDTSFRKAYVRRKISIAFRTVEGFFS